MRGRGAYKEKYYQGGRNYRRGGGTLHRRGQVSFRSYHNYYIYDTTGLLYHHTEYGVTQRYAPLPSTVSDNLPRPTKDTSVVLFVVNANETAARESERVGKYLGRSGTHY